LATKKIFVGKAQGLGKRMWEPMILYSLLEPMLQIDYIQEVQSVVWEKMNDTNLTYAWKNDWNKWKLIKTRPGF
jgi:hypothetical protein